MARTPIHPGEILGDELEEIGLSAKKLAEVIKVPPNRLHQLLAGKRSITADTALRLSQYFGMSADFWMNLQSAYVLDLARQQSGKAILDSPVAEELHERILTRVAHLSVHKKVTPITMSAIPASPIIIPAGSAAAAIRRITSVTMYHLYFVSGSGVLMGLAIPPPGCDPGAPASWLPCPPPSSRGIDPVPETVNSSGLPGTTFLAT